MLRAISASLSSASRWSDCSEKTAVGDSFATCWPTKGSKSPMPSRTKRFAPLSKPASSRAISKSFVSIASNLSARLPPKLQESSPRFETKYLLVTLGEHGMMLFQQNKAPHYIPTKERQVFDVSGAGDTAIALFTLALACEATPSEATEIANHGSAVVVSKLGTATVSR